MLVSLLKNVNSHAHVICIFSKIKVRNILCGWIHSASLVFVVVGVWFHMWIHIMLWFFMCEIHMWNWIHSADHNNSQIYHTVPYSTLVPVCSMVPVCTVCSAWVSSAHIAQQVCEFTLWFTRVSCEVWLWIHIVIHTPGVKWPASRFYTCPFFSIHQHRHTHKCNPIANSFTHKQQATINHGNTNTWFRQRITTNSTTFHHSPS